MSKKRGARMHIFITGATGYIGGAVAARLLADGHRVFGLARTPEKARALAASGIAPVAGALVDLGTLREAAQAADAVINAASADDSMVAHVLVEALEGSGKPLLHTSGTSVAADRALGERSDVVFTEDMPLQTLPERLLRVEVERSVLGAAGRGVRSVVIRPALLYGRGPGLNPHSHQLPQLARIAVARGRPAHVGRGLNVWSHLHIDDLAELYLRTLADAPPGSLYFAESGEASWRDMAIGIGKALGLSGEPEALAIEEALRLLGIGAVTSFGSNSRVSAEKARRTLDWTPAAPSLWDDLGTDYYRSSFAGLEEG
jgi:nucleoside-diphosphate-sugar epimerase